MASTARRYIVEQLEGKCIICGESDIHLLQVDHKLGQGYLEKQYFKNDEEMWIFYVKHWKVEKEYLQVLCSNCNLKKMRVNKENGGVPLTTLIDLLWTKRKNIFEMSNEEFDVHVKFSEELGKQLKELLEKYPQFVPIKKRIDYLQERCEDFIDFVNLYVDYTADAFNFLPPPLDKIVSDKLRKENFEVHDIVKSRALSKWRVKLHPEDDRYDIFKDLD